MESCDSRKKFDEKILKDFYTSEEKIITTELNNIITRIADTGTIRYSWDLLQPLIIAKLNQVFREYATNDLFIDPHTLAPPQPIPLSAGSVDPETSMFIILSAGGVCNDRSYLVGQQKAIIQYLTNLTGIPFTLQRLCEVLRDPGQYCVTRGKLTRALEKIIYVNIVIEPAPPLYYDAPAPIPSHTPQNEREPRLGVNVVPPGGGELTAGMHVGEYTPVMESIKRKREEEEVGEEPVNTPVTFTDGFTGDSSKISRTEVDEDVTF